MSEARDGVERQSWLVCGAGTHMFVLPLADVREVMRPLPLRQVSGTPDYVQGVSIIRGAAVPVIDLGVLFGQSQDTSGRIVTVKASNGTVALVVRDVLGIRVLPKSASESLPGLFGDTAHSVATDIRARDSDLYVFLNTARLISDDLLRRLTAEGEAA